MPPKKGYINDPWSTTTNHPKNPDATILDPINAPLATAVVTKNSSLALRQGGHQQHSKYQDVQAFFSLGILAHLMKMVFMEPKYLVFRKWLYPNHHLTRWLDPQGFSKVILVGPLELDISMNVCAMDKDFCLWIFSLDPWGFLPDWRPVGTSLYIQLRWRLVGFLFGFTPNDNLYIGKKQPTCRYHVDTRTGMRFFDMPFDW